jgi:hypothetical protein
VDTTSIKEKAMTHLMQWQTVLQQPIALRAAIALVLRATIGLLERLAARLEHQPTPGSIKPAVEFGTIELGGRTMGAYYQDGELISVLPDVHRL